MAQLTVGGLYLPLWLDSRDETPVFEESMTVAGQIRRRHGGRNLTGYEVGEQSGYQVPELYVFAEPWGSPAPLTVSSPQRDHALLEGQELPWAELRVELDCGP